MKKLDIYTPFLPGLKTPPDIRAKNCLSSTLVYLRYIFTRLQSYDTFVKVIFQNTEYYDYDSIYDALKHVLPLLSDTQSIKISKPFVRWYRGYPHYTFYFNLINFK